MMNTTILRRLSLVLLLIGAGLAGWNCKPHNYGEQLQNIPPLISLAQYGRVHPNDTLTIARITLDWHANDPDGYVVGYRYKFTNSHDSAQILLNLYDQRSKFFVLMAVTSNPKLIPDIWHYFSTLPNDGLDQPLVDSLARGDSIHINGIPVFASNSDSVRVRSIVDRIVRERNAYPVHTSTHQGTFLLDSPQEINFNMFEIWAIDNNGAESKIPATFPLYTHQVLPPNVGVTGGPTDTSLVVMDISSIYPGIQFRFSASDPNSRTLDYSFSVDRDLWRAHGDSVPWSPWSPNPTAFVSARDFYDPYAIEHTFYVRSRNEFGVVSTDTSYIQNVGTRQNSFMTFYTIFPAFKRPNYHQKMLLVNSVYGPPDVKPIYPASPSRPARATVDTFYLSILTGIGYNQADLPVYTFVGKSGTPSIELLSNCSTIFFIGDCIDSVSGGIFRSMGSSLEALIRSYCNVGGNVIFTGWGLSKSANMYGGKREDLSTFFPDIPHLSIDRPADNGRGGQFIGADGSMGYPSLSIDSSKIAETWQGVLHMGPSPGTNLRLTYGDGWGETIYTYRGGPADSLMNGGPIGVRYLSHGIAANDFNTYFFGFPLYYMQRPAVDSLLSRVLHEMGQ